MDHRLPEAQGRVVPGPSDTNHTLALDRLFLMDRRTACLLA
jgi:hypothetical protein